MKSSNRTRARRGAAVVALAFGLVAAACGGGDGGSDESTEGSGDSVALTEAPQETQAPAVEIVMGGKLVVGGEAEVANPWTPAAIQCDSFCQMRARSFYDPLVVVDENLDYQPYLAETIEPNADNTVFTVTIRQGIKFHDGTDLDAAAVMDNLNRGAKGLLISAALVDLARDPACFAAAAGGSVVGCDLVMEQIDDFTFTIATGKAGDLSKPLPWPGFPYYFGGQWGLIASPTWLAEVDADSTKAPNAVGTGPFMFDSYAPGDKLVVKKNPNYWVKDAAGNALPYLDELEFRVIPDSQVRAAALEAGDLDIMATSDAGVLLDLKDNPDFPTLLQNQYGETNYILLHLTKPYLADQSVRCALLQALDKQDIIDVIDGGNGVPANGPFSPGQQGFLEDNGSLPYDPEAAAAAIEAWEAANGPLTVNYSTTTAARSLQVAQYVQDVWGQVGVDVTITQIEQSKLINNALFGDPAFDAFGWRNHAGLFADQQYYWWHSSAALPDGALALNFGRLNDPQIDQFLEEARSGATKEDRDAAAENLNRRFAEGCFIIPTSYTTWGIVHNTSVQGIGQTPTPDGTGNARDGAGFPGQVWLTAAFKSA